MNAEQKYNSIIGFIEGEIEKGENTKARDILLAIKEEFYIEPRSLSEIFDFLTGIPILTYIKKRQLAKAAQVLLAGGSNQEAIAYTGYSDESGFIKAFSKEFSLSPGNFAKSENAQVGPPLVWATVTDRCYAVVKSFRAPPPAITEIANLFYKKWREAENMQIVYGFDDEVSDVAYNIATRYDVEMRDAFEFVDELIIFFDGKKPFVSDYENWISTYDDVVRFYFDAQQLSFDRAVEIFTRIRRSGIKEIRREDVAEYIERFDCSGTVYPHISEVVSQIGYKSVDDFEDFFDLYAPYARQEDR